jgi:hypothetical protein
LRLNSLFQEIVVLSLIDSKGRFKIPRGIVELTEK